MLTGTKLGYAENKDPIVICTDESAQYKVSLYKVPLAASKA
jgi:hypothetical protein